VNIICCHCCADLVFTVCDCFAHGTFWLSKLSTKAARDSLQQYRRLSRRPTKGSQNHAPFSRLGLNDAQGEPIQINDHVLQIENEYYSLVRPKQVPQAGETPSQALSNRGVGYVELRAVDVNPYSPIGINEDTAGFLEVLALYCLLLDSPDLLPAEQDQIEKNQAEVVNRGRAPNAAIAVGEQSFPLKHGVSLI
jgi:gamma-glutamylcysteine synthetase